MFITWLILTVGITLALCLLAWAITYLIMEV